MPYVCNHMIHVIPIPELLSCLSDEHTRAITVANYGKWY